MLPYQVRDINKDNLPHTTTITSTKKYFRMADLMSLQ